MKKILIIFAALLILQQGNAQFTKASLQASGLTCSMCSKAVKVALEEVPFVEKIQVDIKNQQYNFTFKPGSKPDFDALSKAVEDAGFSVAALKVTAEVENISIKKDDHIKIGGQNFHFLNANGKRIEKTVTFNIVDKGFVSTKEFKKWSNSSKLPCVQTGKASSCCTKEHMTEQSRVYHVTI